MSDTIISQTALEWRIASESPTLDLDTDLYTATALDGQLIAAPTESECNAARRRYEAIAQSAGRGRGWGGARVWVAEDILGRQYFGETRAAAIRNAAREDERKSEAAYSAASCDRAAQVIDEDARDLRQELRITELRDQYNEPLYRVEFEGRTVYEHDQNEGVKRVLYNLHTPPFATTVQGPARLNADGHFVYGEAAR